VERLTSRASSASIGTCVSSGSAIFTLRVNGRNSTRRGCCEGNGLGKGFLEQSTLQNIPRWDAMRLIWELSSTCNNRPALRGDQMPFACPGISCTSMKSRRDGRAALQPNTQPPGQWASKARTRATPGTSLTWMERMIESATDKS